MSGTRTKSSDRMTTLRATPAVEPPSGRHSLLVIVNGLVSSHDLPEGGELVIGRAKESDIQIVDPSVSRRHAVLRMGPPITLEDAGSSNGCQIRGSYLTPGQPVELPLGEAVDVGSAMIMVQHRPAPTRSLRIWAHGYFEGRLEDECIRAERSGATFALLRIHCGGSVSTELVQGVLGGVLRNDDVVGTYGPGDYEVLLVERSAVEAKDIAEQLEKGMRGVGIQAKIGMACFPADGRGAHALAAHAGTAARGEAPRMQTSGRPFVVRSRAMRELYTLVERVAPSNISVLVLGDTGVGKEVLAEAVHRLSPRKDKPFLRLNCAALSESLLESELFGHERGAFTGAQTAKPGLLQTADGGTVFLDEIGELPMAVQVKLLRVLEERQVWRVGSVKPRPIDVRFVAATNRDLETEIERGSFRQDLFFRLNGIALRIPPLRERVEEIEELAQVFIREVCREQRRSRRPELDAEAVQLLLGYSWPGNIRELRNVIERAVLLAGEGAIHPEHLPVEKMRATVTTHLTGNDATPATTGTRAAGGAGGQAEPEPAALGQGAQGETLRPRGDETTGRISAADNMRKHVEAVERQHIIEALNRCGGNQTRAARELGMSRRTFISRLEAYGIPRPLKDRRPGQE